VLLLAAGAALALAWALVAVAHGGVALHERVLLPHHESGAATLALGFASWMTMMIAMMLPPLVPWILVVAAITDRPRKPGALGPAGAFVAGTFAAWIPFALAGAIAQRALAHVLPLDLAGATRYAAASALILAGTYELSPLRAACLRHCRSPIGFFLSRWRDGPMGALELGLRHGAFCLGCCWALMALCFALGAMNVMWMAMLTLVICVEQMAPHGERWSRVVGVSLVVCGTLVLS
jgi:predicted metal-binding membrane protein